MFADVSSQNESEAASRSSISSLRDANHRIGDVNIPYPHQSGQPQKQEEYSANHSAHNFVSDTSRSSVHRGEQDSRLRSDGTSNDKSVYVDETSSVEGSGGRGDNLLDNCGIIPNNCLPCLASTVPTVEKRRSFSTSPPHTKKKAVHKLSFKWKEGHSSSTLREYHLCTYFITCTQIASPSLPRTHAHTPTPHTIRGNLMFLCFTFFIFIHYIQFISYYIEQNEVQFILIASHD